VAQSTNNGLQAPSAPPTLILVPTMPDPDSMPAPTATPATNLVLIEVTATPAAQSGTGAQQRAAVQATPAPTARAGVAVPANPAVPPNAVIPVNGAAPINAIVPANGAGPAGAGAPINGAPTPSPNDPPVIDPRVTGARLQATLAVGGH
jgi:hypothetical protein